MRWSEWQARKAAEAPPAGEDAIDVESGVADDEFDPDDLLDDDQDGEEAA